MAGYTYSKSLDESSSLAEAVNPIDAELSRALSAFDMRHNFVVSYDWRLPIGKVFRRQIVDGRLGTFWRKPFRNWFSRNPVQQ